MPRYTPSEIEPKWQRHWDEHRTFETPTLLDDVAAARSTGTMYVLDMFPYPSGNGLHVGHPEGYTATDIVCRYARMRGKHVLHPMGWDAFGLPAEQHAFRTGTHPAETTRANTDNFRRQLKALGFSYDWSREIATTDEDYFRWTQWIFLQLFDTWYDADHEWTGPDGVARTGKGRPIDELPIPSSIEKRGETAMRRYQDEHRLAYQHEAPVNWCPNLGTVLANEEVDANGRSEVGGHPVERVPLRQWMLRITAYGERLADELDDLQWPDSIKALQRNWIGRSLGAEVDFFVGDSQDESIQKAEFLTWKQARHGTHFPAKSGGEVIRVYTTRPDTLHGATYMVLAPEHPLVETITAPAHRDMVHEYQRQAARKSDLDRTDLAKEKSGVATGAHAINPVNGHRVPIWIADYVLASYGTGAIMAVPAHDTRDFEFAARFGLPIVPVVQPTAEHKPSKDEAAAAKAFPEASQSEGFPVPLPFVGQGEAIGSGSLDGQPTEQAKQTITAELEEAGLGKSAVNFRLRDWLFSRQHYWGEPFPIWHELDADGRETGLLRTDDESDLPVTLPPDFDFRGLAEKKAAGEAGYEPPLAFSPDSWLYKTASDGTRLRRETNSMPQWAGSCWYYLRYITPKSGKRFVDPEAERYWMPVDLYVGGAEHAVLHLLYSRFWHKVLFDRGLVHTAEPFARLVNQGMILGEPETYGYRRRAADGSDWVSADQVAESAESPTGFADAQGHPVDQVAIAGDDTAKLSGKGGEKLVLAAHPEIAVVSRAFKMSKSRGNVINPDDIVRDYGADALRLYEMFMGPLEQSKPWSMSGVEGVMRFLGRVWRLVVDDRADDVWPAAEVTEDEPTEAQDRLLHKTIEAVTRDIETLSFNTAISRMMEFTNALSKDTSRPRAVLEPFVKLLSPFAPHIAEELWQALGHDESLAYAPWPEADESKLVESTVEVPVQVNGKLRGRLQLPAGADADSQAEAAKADETIAAHLDGKTVVKTISIPGRMVNFVVR